MEKVFYRDVRVWNYARTVAEIKFGRFQQINISKKQLNLVVNLKLMTGADFEPNYANFTTSAVFNGGEWKSDKTGNVCPLNTFYDVYSDKKVKTCHTDPISELIMLTTYYEDTQTWVISAAYSIFRSEYVLQNYDDFLNWEWRGSTSDAKIQKAIAEQKNEPSMRFPLDLVKDITAIQFEIDIFSS